MVGDYSLPNLKLPQQPEVTLGMPLANICGHGDVQVPTRDVVIKCCKKAGLKVEKFEIRKGMRMESLLPFELGMWCR